MNGAYIHIERARYLLAGLLTVVALLLAQPALATDYTVTTTDDELDGGEDCLTANVGTTNTDCSLREAIDDANSDNTGDHTITVPAGTYTLSLAGYGENSNATGDLDVGNAGESITITGAGMGSTTVDANAIDRVFHLSQTVVLEDMTITGGSTSGTDDGGGIDAMGTITLRRVSVETNVASDDGGGLYINSVSGSLTIEDSYFYGNQADGGGGLYTANGTNMDVTITGTTFDTNQATSGSGGGVRSLSDLYITNSTFIDNHASSEGGGLRIMEPNEVVVATLDHVTIVDNSTDASGGGGLSVEDDVDITLTITNSILADNVANGNDRECAIGDTLLFTSGDYNLVENTNNCDVFDGDNDITGSDPGMSTLQDNGGDVDTVGFTDPASSPAVNVIPSVACEASLGGSPEDQRGESRTGYCDIGAFEYQDSTVPTISITGDNPHTHECAESYTDAGATANDDIDGDLSGSITTDAAGLDEDTVGNGQSITYDVDDLSENSATQGVRLVNVVDTTEPVITISGPTSQIMEAGSSYTDEGASVTDSCDTSVSVITGGDTVDTDTLGEYTVTYDASDASGNDATQQTRTVTVQDTVAPTITLAGDAVVELVEGETYTDKGANATDAFEGDLTSSIVTVNPVDTDTAGEYTVTYNVSDTSGNSATQVSRTVTVIQAGADDTPKTVDTITQSGGELLVQYEAGASDTFAPHNGSKKFLYTVSSDGTRLITYNGKQVKVFVNGEETAQKSMRSKRPTKKKHFKLKVADMYPDKNYEVIAVMSVKKKNASVGVLRVTSENAVKKKNTKEYKVTKKNALKLKVKTDNQRVIATFGSGKQADKRNFKLTKKGKLKRKS